MPAAVSSNANTPNTENTRAENRGCQIEFAITSSMVSTLRTGSEGSTAQISLRNALASVSGSPDVRTTMVARNAPKMNWRWGMYSSAFTGWSQPDCQEFFTTPTT